MALTKNLISQFAKTVVDKKYTKKETFMTGKVTGFKENGKCYVTINGDESKAFPARVTTNINTLQPVTVMIKNNTATIIGNATKKTNHAVGKVTIANSTSELDIESISDSDINKLFITAVGPEPDLNV